MHYKSFSIENYRAIEKKLVIDLRNRIIPLVGINECGKTTILQAIFSFDSGNDNELEGRHLDNLDNLYEGSRDGTPMVTATIETTPEELESIVGNHITAYTASKNGDDSGELIDFNEMILLPKDSSITIEMSRNLKEKRYEFKNCFNKLPISDQDKIGQELISYLPFILYNDDFNDRPADSITITDNPDNSKSGWEAIFDRVFRSTSPKYSLNSCKNETDSRIRKSILSDVGRYLSDALTDEWRKFSPEKEKISIQLDMPEAKNTLEILLEDDLNGKSRFFSISNRSKGFIWYYNFIMKIRFNPKHTDNIKDTIFLLDEPGSYLHETAQESLCKKLKDISEEEGVVVYCTHSPKLLLPDIIPLNNVLIVEKSNEGCISAVSASNSQTSSVRNTAMQPVFEALMIPEYETIHSSEKILCVEGIYDKYSIELFADIPQECRVFPSVSAEAIINNIQYFIAYKKDYIALWDNDNEGKKCLGKAKKLFGVNEEEHFLLLPSKDAGKRRMEEMFENNDLERLRDEMKMQPQATYEAIISSLYFLEINEKKVLISSVSNETKENFKALSKMIKDKLENNS